MKYIIAYDLGTGGMKASLFDENGVSIASAMEECKTYYPKDDFREQRPEDWWNMLVSTTKKLLSKANVNKDDILGAGCSGHSLGVVPIGENGELLSEYVPVWSDARAENEAIEVFKSIDENEWYLKTGNGFPAKLYSAFKILWYKNNETAMYNSAKVFIGTKDYLNYKLTGQLVTDYSYASGSGVYDLVKCEYDRDYIKKMGLRESDFAKMVESSDVVGRILPDVAKELGLNDLTIISAGGVDNACMAAGAGCVEDGMCYTSLGTSAWIAVTSSKPVVSLTSRPYVFGHMIKGKYASAESTFSAGNTFRWVRDNICQDFVTKETDGGRNAYDEMTSLASTSAIGSNGLMMTPHLAGGTAIDKSIDIRGSFTGLDLMHTRADMIRATLEGICFALRVALDELKKEVELAPQMLIVGGGAKSRFWRELFADIYDIDIITSPVGENAGSLGAMASAAIATGIWKDYTPLIKLNCSVEKVEKNCERVEVYSKLTEKFKKVCDFISEIADIK